MIWKCCNHQIKYGKKILLMGIVNVTPDSFSDGGDWFSPDKAVAHALMLEKQGADILDIGAQSTRPGHTPVSDREEWQRLEPVLTQLVKKTNLPISVDTYYPYVAEKALKAGVCIINDVSGKVDEEMAKAVKKAGAGWIIMHSKQGSVEDVKVFFEESLKKCEVFGIEKNSVCFDMGIGFGKNYEQDLALLANVKQYKIKGYPLLLGCSRKRVIGRSSNQDNPKKRTYGNIAADTAAILGGADIIRFHNVLEEKEGILTACAIRDAVLR